MTELLPPGGWIILTGSLTAVACALVGCFLVLRRMAMLGDAISHAVLPGIVIAFLVTGSRSSPGMLLGAGALGVLTAVVVEFLHKRGRLQEDAAIGVTFTWLFALGVILVSALAGQIDLDQDCVLYGEIAYVPWDTFRLGGVDLGPHSVWRLSGLVILILAFVLLGYSRLKLVSFDSVLATSLGVNVALWHYLLMGAVSITTVASFEIVGAILVVALLVAPPATAYLLTDRLGRMLWLASALGVASTVGGYFLSRWLNASIAGCMGVVAGLFYFAALFFSPTHGILLRRWRSGRSMLEVPGTAALLLACLASPTAGATGHDLFHPVPRAEMRPMSTDRPDLTESPYSVDAGHFQVEADLLTYAVDEEAGTASSTTGLGILNLKAGLTPRIDLQLVVESHIRRREEAPGAPAHRRSGFGDLTARLKYNVWGNDGGSTALALMPFVKVPTNAGELGNDRVEAGLIVPLAVDLPGGWGFGTMSEFDWNADAAGDGRHLDLVTTLVVGRDLGDRLGGFVELFSVVSTESGGAGAASLDAGLTWAVTPDVQLDGGLNLALTGSAEDRVYFLGLSARH